MAMTWPLSSFISTLRADMSGFVLPWASWSTACTKSPSSVFSRSAYSNFPGCSIFCLSTTYSLKPTTTSRCYRNMYTYKYVLMVVASVAYRRHFCFAVRCPIFIIPRSTVEVVQCEIGITKPLLFRQLFGSDSTNQHWKMQNVRQISTKIAYKQKRPTVCKDHILPSIQQEKSHFLLHILQSCPWVNFSWPESSDSPQPKQCNKLSFWPKNKVC